MVLLDNVITFIEGLSEKDFYKYAIGFAVIVVTSMSGIIIWNHYAYQDIISKINFINDERERAQKILNRFVAVERQRAGVDTIIAQDPDFKIAGYLKNLFAQQGLTDKKKGIDQTTTIDREDNYREITLTTQLVDMTMQELTKLLDTIEQQQRVYTKALEITRSKKTPGTIEVTLTMGTLQPKEQPVG